MPMASGANCHFLRSFTAKAVDESFPALPAFPPTTDFRATLLVRMTDRFQSSAPWSRRRRDSANPVVRGAHARTVGRWCAGRTRLDGGAGRTRSDGWTVAGGPRSVTQLLSVRALNSHRSAFNSGAGVGGGDCRYHGLRGAAIHGVHFRGVGGEGRAEFGGGQGFGVGAVAQDLGADVDEVVELERDLQAAVGELDFGLRGVPADVAGFVGGEAAEHDDDGVLLIAGVGAEVAGEVGLRVVVGGAGEGFAGVFRVVDAREAEVAVVAGLGVPAHEDPVFAGAGDVERLHGAGLGDATGLLIHDVQLVVELAGLHEDAHEAVFGDLGFAGQKDRAVDEVEGKGDGAGDERGEFLHDGAEGVAEGRAAPGGEEAAREGEGDGLADADLGKGQLVERAAVTIAALRAGDGDDGGVEPVAHVLDVALDGAFIDAKFLGHGVEGDDFVALETFVEALTAIGRSEAVARTGGVLLFLGHGAKRGRPRQWGGGREGAAELTGNGKMIRGGEAMFERGENGLVYRRTTKAGGTEDPKPGGDCHKEAQKSEGDG